MKHLTYLVLILVLTNNLRAQSAIAQISSDTIFDGNFFEYRCTFENADGEYTAPDFDNLEILRGPSQQFSQSTINGVQSSKRSVSYILKAPEPGKFTIGSASLDLYDENKNIETNSLSLVVLENIDDVRQNPYITEDIDTYHRQIVPQQKMEELSRDSKKSKRRRVSL